MNLLLLLNRASEFAVLIPGMLICMIPVTKWMKAPFKKLLLPFLFVIVILCFVCGYLCVQNDYPSNFFFLPVMSFCIIVYFSVVNLDRLKLLYLFLCAMALLAFAVFAADITDARLNPDYDFLHGFYIYGQIIYSTSCLLAVFLVFAIRHKITWLFEHFHSKLIWSLIWIVPALTVFCSYFMLEIDYSNFSAGNLFFIYLIIDVSLFLFFIFFQIQFYMIAKVTTEKALAETTALLYKMQLSQYEALKIYMEQTSRMRHDFRHVMAAIGELVQNKQYDKLKEYANNYHLVYSNQAAPLHFCSNTSANALLSYYTNIAASCEIPTQFQVAIPEDISVSDVDLSILLGNLLENAVYACKTVRPKERYIHLTADVDTPGALYLSMANSFDGHIKKTDHHFLTTKNHGSAIGLSSIRSIAEKYHGAAEFHADGKEFISNIMLRI